MSVTHFIEAYKGKPPWDIERPQPAFEALADAGEISGPVLDAGCGTGENSLFLAARGFEVVFLVHDALALDGLGRRFATVVDSGLFHTFSDRERGRFVKSLTAALTLGGRYYVLCFSERELRGGGPRRVTQAELRATFDCPPFRVLSIVAAEMAANLGGEGRKAWLARVERVANP